MLHLLLPTAASFALTLLAIFALRPIAIAVDLVDRPGGRKTHFGDVPIDLDWSHSYAFESM